MRIPHLINNNTLVAYNPSPETLELIGESARKLISENFEWNKEHCLTLVELCVIRIGELYKDKPVEKEKFTCVDYEHLLELLPTDLDLPLVIPRIDDEYYWQRRYADKFGLVIRRKPPEWTWKSLYLERHIQEVLEQAQPQYNDEETFDEILALCAPYVRRILLTQLQSWKPPLTMDKEDIPDVYPTEHINFTFILQKLPLVTEFEVVYGVNSVGEDFNWNMFKVSVLDLDRLGKALLDLPDIQILRIHKSKIEFLHCQALMHQLINNVTLVELDLTNCEIGDQGALCVAKVVRTHPTLKVLNLTNNNITQTGAEGIGFVMLDPNCADLDCLNLRLNPLEGPGVMGILRALVRCPIPRELSLAACQFEDDTADNVALMLKMNETLKILDVKNNWFGEEGGNLLIDALTVNTTLEYLDVRDTDINPNQMKVIEKLLYKNRPHPEGEEIDEEEEGEQEYLDYQEGEGEEESEEGEEEEDQKKEGLQENQEDEEGEEEQERQDNDDD